MACCVFVSLSTARQTVWSFSTFTWGTVNRSDRVWTCVGGKAVNAARTCRKLGREPVVVGLFDPVTASLLSQEGIEVDPVFTPFPARCAATLIAGSDGSVTELVQEASPVSEDLLEAVLEKTLAQARAASAVALCGSVPAGCDPEVWRRILAGLPSCQAVVDTRGEALRHALKQKPFVVKVNRSELGELFGGAAQSPSEVLYQAKKLMALGAQNVVVTCGSEDVVAVFTEGACAAAVPAVPVFNTTGCGDAFTGALVSALLEGLSLREALPRCVACASASACEVLPGGVRPETVRRLQRQVRVREL